MANATSSSPLLRLLILILATATRCCDGFHSRICHRAPLSHNDGMPAVRPRPNRHCHSHRSSSSMMRLNAADGEKNDEGDGAMFPATVEGKKPNEEEKDGLLTWEEIMSDPELRKIEYDNSINRKNAMLLPQRISAAVTTLGWLFVGGGILLNQLGLAYVKDPSEGIRIGSLNERDFQLEVVMEVGGRRR